MQLLLTLVSEFLVADKLSSLLFNPLHEDPLSLQIGILQSVEVFNRLLKHFVSVTHWHPLDSLNELLRIPTHLLLIGHYAEVDIDIIQSQST